MRTHTPVSTVDKAEPTHDRQFVSALARGLKVMSVFGAEDQVLSNNEISHRTGLPKPTISRLTYTLCKLGYLSQDSAGRYRLDPHVLTLGFPVLARLSVREIARPMMQALAEQCGVTVSLGLRDGLHLVFVQRIRSNSPVVLQQDIGTRVPIANTALGRAYIAGLSTHARATLIEELHRATPVSEWITLREQIESEVKHYQAHGYCLGGDWDFSLNGAAAPLVLPGRPLLALGCGAASAGLPNSKLRELGVQIRDIVRRIEFIHESSLSGLQGGA